jgi:hypothetical protein
MQSVLANSLWQLVEAKQDAIIFSCLGNWLPFFVPAVWMMNLFLTVPTSLAPLMATLMFLTGSFGQLLIQWNGLPLQAGPPLRSPCFVLDATLRMTMKSSGLKLKLRTMLPGVACTNPLCVLWVAEANNGNPNCVMVNLPPRRQVVLVTVSLPSLVRAFNTLSG